MSAVFILTSYHSFCQNNASNHWHFGFNAAVEFTSGSAVSYNGSAMKSWEGTLTYSDSAGNLMFYSNGEDKNALNDSAAVYNVNHQIMPNGDIDGSMGDSSPGQVGIVLPNPANANQYYMFTVDGLEQWSSPAYKGLRYLKVDMSLDGNDGDVVEMGSEVDVQSSQLLEQITATKHANGEDYWLITHAYSIDTTSKFLVYQLTNSGIVGPLIQYVGDNHSNDFGSMRLNVKGDKLAFGMEVFDFDRHSGLISNPFSLNTLGFKAFSHSGRFLYIVQDNVADSRIYQFDLEATNILASNYLIALDPPNSHFDLRLGPDSSIYITDYNQTHLSVINNPDSVGLACDYVYGQIDLGLNTCWIGLPNYADCDLFETNDDPEPSNITEHDLADFTISVFPNPVKEKIRIGLTGLSVNHIAIYDELGNKVIVDFVELVADLSGIRSGVYFLEIETSEGVFIKKIIKL